MKTELARPTESLNERNRETCLAIPELDAIELVRDLKREFFSARPDVEPSESEKDFARPLI